MCRSMFRSFVLHLFVVIPDAPRHEVLLCRSGIHLSSGPSVSDASLPRRARDDE
jgi:hypothetical protein